MNPPSCHPGPCVFSPAPGWRRVLFSPLHRRASMLDFYFDHSDERPLEAFEDIFASYESKK